jgi:hypothetical protein
VNQNLRQRLAESASAGKRPSLDGCITSLDAKRNANRQQQYPRSA